MLSPGVAVPPNSSSSGVDGSGSRPACSRRQIIETLHGFGIEIGEATGLQIGAYLDMLLRWNAKIALTSVIDPGEILERHFGESIFGAKAAGIGGGKLLDVGSGAGFPAIPIALVVPKLDLTLLEPNLKKAVFLRELFRLLGLEARTRVERLRLEAYQGRRPAFDFITSRAVKVTLRFLDRCGELLLPGGKLILWLGQEDTEAVVRNREWSWNEPVSVPGSARRLIVWGRPKNG